MKYYLIAGEASGDLHGANLMQAIKQKDAQADFRFFGGDLMRAQGGVLVKHYREMAYMGLMEVIVHLPAILKNLQQCKADILTYRPDVIILVDFPGFNLKIAPFAKAHHIRVCYYISPKIWAWNQKRVLKIKKYVDKMLCILPFEQAFYHRWGMDVDYVGNPLLDAICQHSANHQFKKDNHLDARPIVALLPGSREMEIKKLLPVMLQVADKFPEYQFVIAGAPAQQYTFYERLLNNRTIGVVFNQTYHLLQHAQAAMVASGTATLETALFKVPQMVVYKLNPISFFVGKRLVKIKFISLVNLILNKLSIKEFIQTDCNVENCSRELSSILKKEKRYAEIMFDYAVLQQKMGKPGASEKAAEIITKYLNKSK